MNRIYHAACCSEDRLIITRLLLGSCPRASESGAPVHCRDWGDPAEEGEAVLLTACHEGHDDVTGMAIKVLSATVIDGGGPRVSMPSCDLDVTKRNPRIEGSHDEGGPQHVWVNGPEPGSLADGADPTVRRAPIESLAVVPMKDRSFRSPAEDKVERPGHSGNQGDHCRLAPLSP